MYSDTDISKMQNVQFAAVGWFDNAGWTPRIQWWTTIVEASNHQSDFHPVKRLHTFTQKKLMQTNT